MQTSHTVVSTHLSYALQLMLQLPNYLNAARVLEPIPLHPDESSVSEQRMR